jgi:hypothetical protein
MHHDIPHNVMSSGAFLSVTLSVVILTVVMASVVAPLLLHDRI